MPGTFSGNGSVKWVVEASNVKGKPMSEFKGDRTYYQDGLDETPANGRFVITIRYPKNAAAQEAFRKQLADAAVNKSSSFATVTVPIEDIVSGYDPPTDDQIKIDWR